MTRYEAEKFHAARNILYGPAPCSMCAKLAEALKVAQAALRPRRMYFAYEPKHLFDKWDSEDAAVEAALKEWEDRNAK
jgi:hypothetical protein